MFERFSEDARGVVSVALEEAGALGHDCVGTQHLLLGLLGPQAGASRQILSGEGLRSDQVRDGVRRLKPGDGFLTADDAESLKTVGIDLAVVLERLSESFGPDLVPQGQPRRGRARFSKPAKKVLLLALREAKWLKAGAIGSEHLLLGLLRCDDNDLNALLAELSVNSEDLRAATLRTIGRAA